MERIYRSLFNKEIPIKVRDRFSIASGLLDKTFLREEIEEARQACAEITDLEALELAARYRNKLPYLVHQFQLMVRLAETIPESRHEFVNSKDRRLTGVFYVLLSGMRTFIKLVKGFFLLRKQNV